MITILVVVGIVLVIILFVRWGMKQDKKQQEEFLAKYDFSPEQKELFLKKKLFVGMPADVLYFVMNGEGEQNKTHTANGDHIQHVYKKETEYHYVYTDNGYVTSWQSGRAED
jgi:hypothetical protein